MLRIALIGGGVIGRTHANTITHTDGFELAGIADPFDTGIQLAREFSTRHYRDYRELLGAHRPDAVIIATPNKLHVPIALDALSAGVPCLVEKPIATTSEEAGLLVEAVDATHIPVLIGHHRRYHPVIREAKEIIDSGRLGRIVAISATAFMSKPDDYFDVAWHRTAGSGGPFLINLIHEIDLLRHLVGEITLVSAMASSRTRRLPVEDTGALALAFANGALATIVLSDTVAGPWSWDLTAGDSDRFPTHDVDSHRIGGEHASLTLPTLDIWEHDGARTWTTPMHAERVRTKSQSPYVAQLRHLGAVITEGIPPLVNVREGTRDLAIIEAVTHSVATRTTVTL